MSASIQVIDSSLNNALNSKDSDILHHVLDALRQAAIDDSDELELIRTSVSKYLPILSESYLNQALTDEFRLLSLRIIGNSIADTDGNREIILQNKPFITELVNSIGPGNDLPISFINIILSVIFNLCNDFDPAVQIFTSKDNPFASNLFHTIEKHFSNDDFLANVALLNVELLTDKSEFFFASGGWAPPRPVAPLRGVANTTSPEAENVPENAALMLLDIHDNSVSERLFALISTFPNQELSFTNNRNHFQKLLQTALEYINEGDPETPFNSVIAAMGNISSHGAFSELIGISADDHLFRFIVDEFVKSDNASKVAVGSCLLGNLAVSAEKVARVMDHIPGLIPLVMPIYNRMKSPFELQSAHLIKNLILTSDNVHGVLENEGVALVKKLVEVKIFPVIRVMGVQIARGLLSKAAGSDRDELIEVVLELAEVEDDTSVQIEIDNTLIAIVDSRGSLNEKVVEQLLKGSIREGKAWTTSEQKGPLLVRMTRALGVVSSNAESVAVFANEKNAGLTSTLLEIGIELGQSAQTDSANVKGVINNITFISANLQQLPPLNELATQLLRLAINPPRSGATGLGRAQPPEAKQPEQAKLH